MSDGAVVPVGDVLRVLVVGDSSRIDAAMDALTSAFDPASVVRERTVSAAVDRLADAETAVDCIVCEFDGDGAGTVDDSQLVLLEERTDVPIVAVADAADEPTADRALAAGATDVVDADDPQQLVATRVKNAAQRHRLSAAGPDADRDGRNRYRSILESSDALVFVVDETGAIAYASPAVESRLGYTSSELERTSLERIVHPEDRETVRETVAAVADAPFGSSERCSVRLGDGDGTWRVVELAWVNRLTDPAVDGLVVTVAGAARADPDAAGDAALERLAEPFFALGPDRELRYANAAATRLFDGEPRPGTVVWELLPDGAREPFAERLREADASGSAVGFDVAVDDRRFEVTAYPDGDDDGLSVLAREVRPGPETEAGTGAPDAVDERRARERDRRALLESTIDALSDGVAVLEGSTIRFANATLLELTGAPTLAGREIDALFDDDLAATVRERARSPIVRWMEPVQGELETADDGDAVPVDVTVTPLPEDERDRTLCVVRDRRGSAAAALSAVCRTLAALRDAESEPAVRRAAVDGIRACAEAEVAAWYLLDADALRPAAVATADDRPSVELPPIDRGAVSGADALETDEPTVCDRSALEPLLSRAGIRAERVLVVPIADRGVVLATSTEPMAFEALDLDPPTALAGAAEIALERLEERSRVRDCRRESARLESQVRRSERVRDVERDLLSAETRSDVERRLCEGVISLAGDADTAGTEDELGSGVRTDDLDAIELVWIGRVGTGRETVSPRTWTGDGGEFLETTSAPIDPDADGPTGRTAATRDVAVVDDLAAAVRGDAGDVREPSGRDRDPDADSAPHERALERGFRSALSVPVEHGEFRYGTLTAYARRPAAFDGRARSICEHLARVAGYAIGALERKRALLADSVAELEIVVRDESEPLSAIARRADSRVDVRSVVPRSSGGSTVYCAVPGADAATIRAAAEAVDAVESVRFAGDERADEADAGAASPIEFTLSESTVADTLAEYGGVLRSITPADEHTRLVIDLSSTVDVRSFVRTLERSHPGTELVARRERDRSAPSARAFDAELRDRLSERQLRTLEAAYYGGFFDWPRESTGEDVAESLGVSQPTFSRHLRLAQRKLFELLFEERSGDDSDSD